jgi:translation elongation factor EF-1beta
MCPRSLDLLSRAVHLDISPDMSSVNVEELADAILKVLDVLL